MIETLEELEKDIQDIEKGLKIDKLRAEEYKNTFAEELIKNGRETISYTISGTHKRKIPVRMKIINFIERLKRTIG